MYTKLELWGKDVSGRKWELISRKTNGVSSTRSMRSTLTDPYPGMNCHQVSRFHMKGELDECNETKYSSPLQKILVAMVTNVRETWRDSWNVKLSICTINHECSGEIYWLLLSAIITKSLYDVFKLPFNSLQFISFDFTLEDDFWAPVA